MPELPEVETIARQIRKHYLGKMITEVKAKPARIFVNCKPEEFSLSLVNKKLKSIDRYGKFMIWEVDEIFPVFHLGMSGIFIQEKKKTLYPKHIHVSFKFADNSCLYFLDVRKFGKIFLYKKRPKFTDLGPDPLAENFTLNNFRKLLTLTGVGIKSFLMDQHRIAGIGNIYANEALYLARINPFRPANKIKPRETEKLYQAIRFVLEEAISHFGTTYTAYQTVEGTNGENQNFLKVYQKENEPCERCGGKISKVLINNRSTFYCKKCQK